MPKARGFVSATAVIAVALVLGSCGGSSVPLDKGAELSLHQLSSAMKAARSVRVTGTVTTATDVEGRVDIVLYAGGDLAGIAYISSGTVKILEVSQTFYLMADVKGLQALAQVSGSEAQRLSRIWISAPSSTVGAFVPAVSLGSLASSLGDAASTARKLGKSTVDGEPTTEVRTADGTTVWIATTVPPYPVEITGPVDGAKVHLAFGDWNASSPPKAPSHSESLSSIIGGAAT